MMPERETIIAPETKPASEILFGCVVQKTMPSARHGRLEGRFVVLLSEWADERDFIGTEVEFRIGPPDEPRRSLVPGVAYIPHATATIAAIEAVEYPPFPPLLAVEILSPHDRPRYVAHKVDVYRRSGVGIVLLVDPADETFDVYDDRGGRTLTRNDLFTHPLLPGFAVELARFFG